MLCLLVLFREGTLGIRGDIYLVGFFIFYFAFIRGGLGIYRIILFFGQDYKHGLDTTVFA